MSLNPIRLQEYVGGLDYPVSREDLVRRAQEQGADQEVLHALQSLPRDEFNSPDDVTEALGDLR